MLVRITLRSGRRFALWPVILTALLALPASPPPHAGDLDSSDPSLGDHASVGNPWPALTSHDHKVMTVKGQNFLRWISESADQATTDMRDAGKITRQETSQSPWTDYKQLHENGWFDATADDQDAADDHDVAFDLSPESRFAAVADAMLTLGLSSSMASPQDPQAPNHNVICRHQNRERKHVNGKEYPGTEAVYKNVFNAADGVIVAYDNESPTSMVQEPELQEEHPGIEPPPLSRWSDVAFLQYEETARGTKTTSARGLRYVFRVKCMNLKTRPLILAALRSRGLREHEIPVWQHRQVFSMTEAWGQAMLGSPNGEGVAWLLINHKAVWGRIWINKVAVFLDSYSAKEQKAGMQHPTLLFELVDEAESAEG